MLKLVLFFAFLAKNLFYSLLYQQKLFLFVVFQPKINFLFAFSAKKYFYFLLFQQKIIFLFQQKLVLLFAF